MKKQYQTNYKKLNKITNLTKLKNPKTIKTTNGYTTTITKLSTSNSYFYILSIASIDTSTNSYREFVLRIWENKLAQIVRYKEAYFRDFEEVYIYKNGLEIKNDLLSYTANKSFRKLISEINSSLFK